MDLPQIRNPPSKADEGDLPSLRKLLPRQDQEKPMRYTIRDSARGPTLAPMHQPGAHSLIDALNNGKEPALEPKLRTALMSALNNFQVPGDSIPKLVSGTSTLMRLDTSSSTYQSMFSMDDTLVATICKIVNTIGRIPHVPHCGRCNCKLLAGCDIAYNPYSDPCGLIRDDDRRREKTHEPYKSPFQRELTVHSPKKRKLSDDTCKSSECQPADGISISSEPTGPFSERSWLALELFLIMNWTNPDCPGHIIVDGLLKIIPVLDLKECFALDMLRVTYPVPNIYDDDDEDETTEGAKIHKLHEKVWHMPPDYLTPRMNEIYWRLMQLGHLPDLVLMPPSQDWDPSINVAALIDEPGYNYCFIGGDNKLYYISARFTIEDIKPAQLQISLEEYQEVEQRELKKRNDARNSYLDRLRLHDMRNQAAMEAIRMVHELIGDPSTNARIQVEAVRLQYERRGVPWHWKFSRNIGPIDHDVFAHWVDKLDNKEFAYALTPIQDWAIAGIKLGKSLKAREAIYTSATLEHVTDNLLNATGGELSPGKRLYSEVSWDTEDEEIPSNSPPPDEADILRFEQQRIIGLRGMTEDDLLKQVLEQSMNDIGGDRHITDTTPVKQTKPVSVVPAVADQQPDDFMTPEEIDELDERMFEWALSMSSNPSLGPFPKKQVADDIKSKRPQRHASLAQIIPRSKVQPNHQVPQPSIEAVPPKATIAAGGLDGVEEQLPLLTPLGSGLFPESFERGWRSRHSPTDRAASAKDDRMKVDYIVDAVHHSHENILPANPSYNPYKEIVAKAARHSRLIDMETYQRIFNEDRTRASSGTQKYYEWLHRLLSRPADSIDMTDQKHAAENEPFFQDAHHVSGPPISQEATIRKQESKRFENTVAVHVEEVGEDGNDEIPPQEQGPPTEHDIALRTLKINKQMWLKEDEEYKRITSSDNSLSQHLAQDDVPLSRRSNEMVSVVIRDQEQREAWILKKVGVKAGRSLPLLTPSAPAFIPAAAAVVRASSRPRSRSSHHSMSCVAASEEGANVSSIARDLAVAVDAPPRPYVSAAAVGSDRIASAGTEPFPIFEKIELFESVMPVAAMEFHDRGILSSKSARSGGGVSPAPVINVGRASSPVHGENGTSSQSTGIRRLDAVSEVRKTLAKVEVIPGSPRENSAGDVDPAKMPGVAMIELSPDHIAKEA